MDESTLAYVAGAIDLLGLIRIRNAEGTELPVVQMHGNYMEMLDFLGKLTGTKAIVTRRDYTRAGCSEHCAEKHQHIVSVSGRWSLTGAKATVVLWNIRPYLRLQAEKADSAIVIGTATGFKAGTLEKMRELGWEIPDFQVPGRPTCSIRGCPDEAKSRGWCNKHYIRFRRYGDPLGGAGDSGTVRA